MQQLEIEYFFPLTEQIPLDLDYSGCAKQQLWTTGTTLNLLGGGLGVGTSTWSAESTIQFRPNPTSVGYWQIGQGIQMHNEKRPSWLHQQMSKIFFGWEWKDK